jgi:tetratricopeptide (TPR) repeat protein
MSDSDEDPFGIGLDDGIEIEDEVETTRSPLCDSRLLELLVVEGATEEIDAALLAAETSTASDAEPDEWTRVQLAVAKMAQQLVKGQYPDLLRDSEAALFLLAPKAASETALGSESDYSDFIRSRAITYVEREVSDVGSTAETELVRQCRATATLFVGAAALQLFAQANYTGPTIEPSVLKKGLEPYPLFGEQSKDDVVVEPSKQDTHTQVMDGGNAAEFLGDKKAISDHSAAAFKALEVDGEFPYKLAEIPCQLLVAHSLIQALAQPQQHAWHVACPVPPPGPPIPMLPLGMDKEQEEAIRQHHAKTLLEFTISQRSATGDKRIGAHHNGMATSGYTNVVNKLCTRCWWHARVALAHERLLLVRERTHTLWMGVKQAFLRTYEEFGLPVLHTTEPSVFSDRTLAIASCFKAGIPDEIRQIELCRRLCVRLHLEYGLSQHFFQHPNKGKFNFMAAKDGCGLRVELTGAMGRRTKFQQKSTAQLVLLAASTPPVLPLSAEQAAKQNAVGATAGGDVDAPASSTTAHEDDGGEYAGKAGDSGKNPKIPGMASIVNRTWGKDSVLTNEHLQEALPPAPPAKDAEEAGKEKSDEGERKGVDGQINFDHGHDGMTAMIDGEVTGTLKGAKQTVTGEESTEVADEAPPEGAALDDWLRVKQEAEGVEADELVTVREVGHDALDKHTALLEGIAFDDDGTYRSDAAEAVEAKMTVDGKLDVIDQAILLGLCLDVSNSNPSDGLTNEEMQPYIDRVLCNPLNWMVYSTALLERAWLECEVSRVRDRAVLQMQALVDQHTTRLTLTQSSSQAIEESAKAEERLEFLHSLAFPPRWELQRDLADRYRSLGVIGSAKQIYEELEMWDDTVECYTLLDQRNRAETIIRKELQRRPTPMMWCCLGDIKQGMEQLRCYERSWVLSKGRFARAKRSLGRHFFEMKPTDPIAERVLAGAFKDFDGADDEDTAGDAGAAEGTKEDEGETAERMLAKENPKSKKVGFAVSGQKGSHDREVLVDRSKRLIRLSLLQMLEATKVAPLYIAAWFLQGVIAMRLEEWNVALKSFARVVSLDIEQGEAWGNMGGIHMRQGDFNSAVTCLQNGLREKRSSWQMWENLIVCCVESERYGDAMAAIREHVMLGERQTHSRQVDVQALRDLVRKLVVEKYVCDETEQAQVDAAETKASAAKEAAAGPDEAEGGDLTAMYADMEDDSGKTADEEAEHKKKVAAATEQGNNSMAKRLGELLEWIVQRVPTDWKLWDVMGMYYLGYGNAKRGLECYLSESRAMQTGDGAGWESNEKAFKMLVAVAVKVVHVYLVLAKRQNSTKLTYAAGMYVRGIKGKATTNLSHTDAYKRIVELEADVAAASN